MAATISFDGTEDLLDIRFDNVFKAVFTRETADSNTALARLVSAVIGWEVAVLEIVANEPAQENLRDRQIRFDINCRTEDGERIGVEMSLSPTAFEPARLEYYAARLFGAQDIKGAGRTYSDLKRTCQIAILAERSFFPDGDFLHSFEYYDPERGVPLGGRSRIFTLELSKLGSVAEKPAWEMSNRERWAVFFRYLTDSGMRRKINEILALEEGIAMAGRVLQTISRDETERARLESELKNNLDWQNGINLARREGRTEGEMIGERKSEQRILAFLDKGYTAEDIRRELAGR